MPLFDVATLTAINQSSLLVALRRAAESTRPDALFHDLLAESIAAELAASPMSQRLRTAAAEMAALSGDAVALRTRHYDERIEHGVRRGIRQIVMLGVGLDGRAHRLNLDPDTRFFELDQPAVIDARQAFLDAAEFEPKYRRTAVAAVIPVDDLRAELQGAGFRADEPALFVAEGLLFYLKPEDVTRLVAQLGSIASPGSVLLAEYPAARPLTLADQHGEPAVTADFDKEVRPDPWDLFEPSTWLVDCCTLANLASIYGRSLPRELDERRGGARWWYATATRS